MYDMTRDIIKQQQEVAQKTHPVDDFHGHHIISPEDLDTLIATIIANIGRELEASVDGLPGSQAVVNPAPLSLGDVMISKDRTLTLIRSITGISPTH